MVAGKDRLKLIEHIKIHNTRSRCGNPSNTYTKPPKSPFHLSTDSCLQSDNGVSTSNSPPAGNIVMIYPDYYSETCIPEISKYYTVFLYPNLENKMLHLQKHSNPFLISANTLMTIKPKPPFSIFHQSF